MSDTVAEVARGIGRRSPQTLKQLKRMIRRMLDRHDAAARLFLDDHGDLKAEARTWFQQLAEDNFVNGGAWHSDPREHAKREGQRELALKIIGSANLDVDRLNSLTRMEREMQ